MLSPGIIYFRPCRMLGYSSCDQLVTRGRVQCVSRYSPFSISREEEVKVLGGTVVCRPYVAAWLAHALHGCQHNHIPCPLCPVGRPAGSSSQCAPGGQHSLTPGPLSSQGPDISGRYSRFFFSPFTRLGKTIFLTKYVSFPLLKSVRTFLNIFLIVRAFRKPDIGDSRCHRRIGPRPGSKPFVGKIHSGGIIMLVYDNHFDPQLLEPGTPLI